MNPSFSRLLGAIVAATLSACASKPVVVSTFVDNPPAGLVYALPKAQVQIEAVRKVVTKDDVDAAQKDQDAKRSAYETARKNLAAATEALAAAQSNVDSSGDAAQSIKDELQTKLAVARVLVRARAAEAETAKILVDEAGKKLAQAQTNLGKMDQTVTLKALPPVPDRTRRFVAVTTPSVWRDDVVKLTTSNGLLNTTTSESTGQAGAILVNLVSAVAAAKAPAGKALSARTEGKAGADECKPFSFSAAFDPTNIPEVNGVRAALQSASQQALTISKPTAAETPGAIPGPAEETAGLVYRAPVAVTVEVQTTGQSTSCTSPAPLAYASLTATVPDATTLYSLPVRASDLTKNKVDLAFKDGMPVSYFADEPSRGVAVSRIPIDIMKAIVEVPASILKLRVDYDSQAVASVDAHTKQLQAQLELLKAQQALEEAQNAASAAP